MTIAYTTGQITLTNGSAVVTGIGTAWQVSLIAGGFIAAEADGNPLPIETVDSDTSITAAIEWKGATGTYDYALVRDTAYLQQLNVNSNTLARLIAELDAGTIFKYDASGDLVGRATYDERVKGFSYLVFIGVDEPALYVKASAAAGDWDGPFAYGTGPVGPMGPAGYANPRGNYSALTAYNRNDAVLYNGSSFVALQATTGNAPPTLPTTANVYWQLTAIKGTDGSGTGDVVGPAGATDDRLAVFNGTTGKAVKDGGKTVAEVLSRANHTGDIPDSVLFADDGGPTKKFRFEASAITAGQTRVITVPDRDVSLDQGWEKIGSIITLSGQSFIDWTGLGPFSQLLLEGHLVPSVAAQLQARISYDNGLNFNSGASEYGYSMFRQVGTTLTGTAIAGYNAFPFTGGLMDVGVAKIKFEIAHFNKAQSALMTTEISYFEPGTGLNRAFMNGYSVTTTARNALRVFLPSGTMTNGTFLLRGIRG
ncbi:hypothetical protein [Rhizobium sp. S163]|uniref:hypothetical protein n=1 Tax=Rhizobium sp. S163 TaxID=3055039 RepID=UPI0025AA032D|nr:hypothetical protein [Rhizobium sp. S163]MDM9644458.1 hypothetical protein [Rhizobium sp. S163]